LGNYLNIFFFICYAHTTAELELELLTPFPVALPMTLSLSGSFPFLSNFFSISSSPTLQKDTAIFFTSLLCKVGGAALQVKQFLSLQLE
jgi:hypothetical protein